MFFLFGGSRRERPELYAQASPASWVSSDDSPIFLYHGSADHLVPLRNAERMYAALKQAGVPCELKIVPEAGHVPAMFNSEAARAAVKFLDEHLKAPTPGEQAVAPAATSN
jgi:dipeptidyl aminopeptidase/acylaminoacyl peptidase